MGAFLHATALGDWESARLPTLFTDRLYAVVSVAWRFFGMQLGFALLVLAEDSCSALGIGAFNPNLGTVNTWDGSAHRYP